MAEGFDTAASRGSMACVDADDDILPVVYRPVQNCGAGVNGGVIRVLPGIVQGNKLTVLVIYDRRGVL